MGNAQQIDNGTLERTMKTIAATQGRNYVVMSVKDNLMQLSRQALLKSFPSTAFKKVAHVQMGEPPAEFKKKAVEVALKNKQEASDKAFQLKKQQEKAQKLAEKKRKDLEKAKKKAEEERQRKVEAAKKQAEILKKAAEKEKAKKEGKELPAEE